MRRFRRLVAAVASALLASATAGPAFAALPSYPTVVQAPYCAVVLTTAAAVTLTTPCPQPGISGGARAVELVGVVNVSSAAQTTATMTCYDNATAASGTIAAAVGQLAATQIISWPGRGRPVLNGLTCQPSSAPSGGGIEVDYR